jgi:hypothetical protein
MRSVTRIILVSVAITGTAVNSPLTRGVFGSRLDVPSTDILARRAPMRALSAAAALVFSLCIPVLADPPALQSLIPLRQEPARRLGASRESFRAADDLVASPQMTGWNIDIADVIEIGSCLSIDRSGDLVYAAFKGTLCVIDVSVPDHPVKVGYLQLAGVCWDIARYADYLFCYCQPDGGDIVEIVDVSDHAVPTPLSAIPGAGYSLDIDGDYLYIEYGDGLRVLDISTPTSPVLLGSSTPGGLDLDAEGGYVYSAVFSKGLRVTDATNPANPVVVGTHPTGFGAQSVVVQGSYAYLGNIFPPGEGLYVVDVSTPTAPATVGFYATPEGAYIDIAVEADHVFALDNYSKLDVFDITSPSAPLRIASSPITLFDPRVITLAAGSALIGGGGGGDPGMCIMDVTDPESPTASGTYLSLPFVNGLDAVDGFIAMSIAGARVITMSKYDTDERHYSQTYHYTDGYELAVQNGLAFMAHCDSWYNDWGGFAVLDVSDPRSPVDVAFQPSYGGACYRQVSVGATHVYLAGLAPFLVVDASNPAAPVVISQTSNSAVDIFAVEPYVYAAAGYDDFRVIDVSNPAAPVYAGTGLSLGGIAEGVWVSGQRAYIASNEMGGGLSIIDISNPLQPVLEGQAPGWFNIVCVKDPYAYVAGDDFVRIIDVGNPAQPIEVGNIETGHVGSLLVSPPFIYAVQYGGGAFLVLQTDLMTSVPNESQSPLSLRQNFPNPFNPSTTISFETPASGRVRIEIFDVTGKLIRRLVDETLPAGLYVREWDGRDANGRIAQSGVYFYRLSVGGKSEAKKMILLK